MEPRSIEEGQVWRVVETGELIRVRLFRWSDFGTEIEAESLEDPSVRMVWTLEDFKQHCERHAQ